MALTIAQIVTYGCRRRRRQKKVQNEGKIFGSHGSISDSIREEEEEKSNASKWGMIDEWRRIQLTRGFWKRNEPNYFIRFFLLFS